ncbi:uncharacterized protein LOC112146927 [Oryzias melastigma]|uniref:Glycosyltransferase family 92 protein n=1 Tax=Oryzias melastigma TaxID=30732 RepID=A0A3B3BYE1_ORYME|nr:uncharacterized protein LOC112146927 [Oryzias melastigma]
MEIRKCRTGILLFMVVYFFIAVFNTIPPKTSRVIPKPKQQTLPFLTSQESITPLFNTKHFMVSAFMDQRRKAHDIRIIGIFKRNSIRPLHCFFYCGQFFNKTTSASVLQHLAHFKYPYGPADVLCRMPENCSATHVTLLTQPSPVNVSDHIWLPIRNKKNPYEEKLNFTVCISTLYGDYNNVLQFAQTLEVYKLLGVNRVVIYNTSCGPELDRLLKSYSEEGFVEIVQWPIKKYLNPSSGWKVRVHKGDLQYFGQVVTLNECVYRSMERSRYVVLSDIDEIPMPYQHNNLNSLMASLHRKHRKVAVFILESHVFPKIYFDPSERFRLPQWSNVSGINILEHIYREDPDRKKFLHFKMIVQPKRVEQTSVHDVLRKFGGSLRVPWKLCRFIHIHVPRRTSLKLEELKVDKRLWDFQEKLIPNVDKALQRAGLLTES